MAEQVLYRRPSLLLFALEIPRATADAAVLGPAWPLLRLAPHGDGHPVLTLPGFCGSLPTGWRSRRARGERSELMEQLPGCSGSNEKNNEPEVPAHSDDHWRRGDPGPVER